MRFEYYHSGLDEVPKLSVDGTVDNAVHFSHWHGNQTPQELKADTSTEIALNLVASPQRDEFTRGIDLVTNNHFDTDGVLSVWTVLNGARALDFRDQLIPAAVAGDFSEFINESAVRTSIAIQGTDQPIPGEDSSSPLASYLAGETVLDDARAYELVLPEVERLLTNVDSYEPLWRKPWERIAKAIDSFNRGASTATEFGDARLTLVTLAPDQFGPGGFDPAQHSVPFTAISGYAKGDLFLIATEMKNGWAYRIDYPYYSWAETVVRPPIPRRDFSYALGELNRLERNAGGKWQTNNVELTAAVKFLGSDGLMAGSTIGPFDVAKILSDGYGVAKVKR